MRLPMEWLLARITLLGIFLGFAGCHGDDIAAIDRDDDSGPASDLVAWWKFEEGGGASVTDYSGFGNTAIIQDGEWGDGRTGGGLLMDGGNNSILIVPLSESLRSTAGEITVMSWSFRTDEHNVAVIAHEYPTLFFGFHGPQFKWEVETESTLFIRVARRLGLSRPTGAACYAGPSHRAVLDKWIHMAATYDGSRARLYVDGTEICNRRLAGAIRMPNEPFTISGYLNEAGEIIDEITGRLDDVRIYNRALNETEIRSVYSDGME